MVACYTILRTLLHASSLLLAATGCSRLPTEKPVELVPQSQQSIEPVVQDARPPATARPGRPQDITFDDIKLDMEKTAPFTRDLLPQRVRVLEQQRIRIRGYILPSFQQSGLTQFVLVRDNMECCFGPGAALYDCIVVRMLPGRSAQFSIRPVAVTGLFQVEELRGPSGKHLAIYALNGEEVQ